MSGVRLSVAQRQRLEAAAALAALKGAKFPGDTPAARLERMTAAVLDPLTFGRTYLPHYFRDQGSPVHRVLVEAARLERRVVVRVPRGHAKSTVLTLTHILHHCCVHGLLTGLVTDPPTLLAACRDGAVARQTELAQELEQVLDVLPQHWDPEAQRSVEAWVSDAAQRLRGAAAPLPLPVHPYIQVVSEDLGVATEFTAAARQELELNPLLRSDWGDLTPCYSGDWGRRIRRAASESDWECLGTRVRAFGMAQGLRGGKHGPWRPTLVILDDPDGEATVRTRSQRDGNAARLGRALTYGLEPQVGRAILVGTPHHPDCLVARYTALPELRQRWVGLRFCAEDGRRVLYPAKWSLEALEEERKENPDYFDSELGDRPPAQEARPFHTLHYYDRSAIKGPLPTVLAVDPSYGRTATSDLTAVVVVKGPTPEGHLLIWRCDLLRLPDPEQFADRINAIWEEERPDLAVIEAIALGSVLESLATARGRRAHLFPGWVRLERQSQGKDLRIRGTAPLLNDGTVRLPSDGSCRQLERQYLDYGDSGSKVDGPDAVEMALRMLRQRTRTALAHTRHRARAASGLAAAWLGREEPAWA